MKLFSNVVSEFKSWIYAYNMGALRLPSILLIIIARLWVDASDVETDRSHKRELASSFTSTNLNFQIRSDPKWPNKDIEFGQVSGVALDTYGNVYVFHRGPRIWNEYTFDNYHVFIGGKGPIVVPTVAIIHPSTGDLLNEWGRQMFYLPHGITVDNNNNVWITDVAMHQVFKFPPIINPEVNNSVPLLTLGSKLKPGSENNMFCKPTAVAVETSGKFFVSDGYCNARVIKFDADGTFLMQWGRRSTSPVMPNYHLDVPHDLSLAEDKDLLYVSDRENGRIQCFLARNGSYVYQINSHDIGSRLFSASYTPSNDGLLFIINGPALRGVETVHGSVVTASADFKIVATFQPETSDKPTFTEPHDIIVSPNGTSMYVAELKPFRVWKFDIVGLRPSSSVFKGKNTGGNNSEKYEDGKTSGTMLMAIFITAIVLCFGAVLLTTALVYSRARTYGGCSGHCKHASWLVGRSPVEGFKLGNFLGQQNQGFVKLNSFEESDDDDANVSPTSFA